MKLLKKEHSMPPIAPSFMLFIIVVIFSMIVNQRIREMGLLRAMGARRETIFRLTITGGFDALFYRQLPRDNNRRGDVFRFAEPY
jgi:hypothetical protein